MLGNRKKNKKDKKKLILTSVILTSIVLFTVILSTVLVLSKQIEIKQILENDKIYSNIYIENINVSNLTKEEAKVVLSKINEKINLNYNEIQYSFDKTQLGLIFDIDATIEKAYLIGREGSKKERLKVIKDLETSSQYIPVIRKLDKNILKQKLEEIAKNIDIQPKNAQIKKTNNIFEVSEGTKGIKVNIEETLKETENALLEVGDKAVTIKTEQVEPKYKAEDLKQIQHKLGSFSTKYKNNGGNDANRIVNLKVAAEKINGTVLYPGEIFSTNEKFGATTKANGYKPAPTIINGKLVDEYGGGVCQVSSTLYNAVLYSELDVVERQNHSLKVGYLDYGFDATLAGDYIDLKFKNSTNYPIYIESYVTSNEVICNVYGYDERPSGRTIKFENALVDVIEPSPKIIKETDTLLEGEEKVQVNALTGYKYKLYKLIYQDGKLVDKQLVNNSYYKPRAAEVLVGTKKATEVSKITNSESPKKNDTNTSETNNKKQEQTTQQVVEEITEATSELPTEEEIIEEIIVE